MDINLMPGKVVRLLILLAVGFTVLHIIVQLADLLTGRSFGLFVFDLSGERSIPRFFAAVMLLICSILLLVIGAAKKEKDAGSSSYWIGLAVILLLLAIAQSTAFHENLAVVIRSALNMSKIQFYAWIYGLLVALFSVLYLRFLLSLPRRTILLLFIGGSAFIAGAFGLDLAVAYIGRSVDHQAMLYVGLSTLEEVLQMGGIIVLLYGLLEYMSSEFKWIRVRIAG